MRHGLYYDDDDYRLLEVVNSIIARGRTPSNLRKLFETDLHPHGIKELGAPRAIRIATAMIDLIGTLERGTAQERIAALRAVREESIHQSGKTLRLNGARVLLQIMKEILRATDDEERQLALAHDFRQASSGKARRIRSQLRKYHLLEMPEAWNQLAFDYHVHDANTKGRKTPTHLIMDAWIKGIRDLGVIYYSMIRPEAAAELLEAAEIMGITIRIGIEVTANLRGKPVNLMWIPRGFMGSDDFLSFLKEQQVEKFFARGREVVEFETNRVLALLDAFNSQHLAAINERFDIKVPKLKKDAFLEYVGTGQASLVHLAEFAHAAILEQLERRTASLSQKYDDCTAEQQQEIRQLIASFNEFDSEALVEQYLRPEVNPGIPHPSTPMEGGDLPKLLRLKPSAMLDRLEGLPCRSRITLNPSNPTPAEVLEVLYTGRGRITHLEIFNLKDWAQGRVTYREKINQIRLVINRGNVVEAKQLVREIMASAIARGDAESAIHQLRSILWDLPSLIGWYAGRRLRSRIGSDSIGHSQRVRGMGFVIVPTLTLRGRLAARRDPARWISVTTVVERHITDTMQTAHRRSRQIEERRHGRRSVLQWRRRRRVTWSLVQNSTTLAGTGNIVTLGGLPDSSDNGLCLKTGGGDGECRDAGRRAQRRRPQLRHLNTGLLNASKILIGFVPAFLTFYLTKDWWLLAYLGAVIWFAITGLRNILQSVVGGGGIKRSHMLNWTDYVSWSRVSDSLLYTGLSVPLLDYLVKQLMLARGLGITIATAPVALYTVMALVNSVYISGHNLFRGLPTAAVVGNFFRALLSIPVAIALNFAILRIATGLGVPTDAALAGIQLWASVISKTASDLVGAIIEGSADRQHNVAERMIDYREKLAQVYDTYGRFETAFPETEVLSLLASPHELFRRLWSEKRQLFRSMAINSLDLMYFWMYQPRARTALLRLMERMSPEERFIFSRSQKVLNEKHEISEMLLDGLVGKRFERALAFYLAQSERYLKTISRMAPEPAPSGLLGLHHHDVDVRPPGVGRAGDVR
jgi:hypothetical protein